MVQLVYGPGVIERRVHQPDVYINEHPLDVGSASSLLEEALAYQISVGQNIDFNGIRGNVTKLEVEIEPALIGADVDVVFFDKLDTDRKFSRNDYQEGDIVLISPDYSFEESSVQSYDGRKYESWGKPLQAGLIFIPGFLRDGLKDKTTGRELFSQYGFSGMSLDRFSQIEENKLEALIRTGITSLEGSQMGVFTNVGNDTVDLLLDPRTPDVRKFVNAVYGDPNLVGNNDFKGEVITYH